MQLNRNFIRLVKECITRVTAGAIRASLQEIVDGTIIMNVAATACIRPHLIKQ